MLPRFKSPFRLEDSYGGHACSEKKSLAVGLRILVQISHGESNILVKSALRSCKPSSQTKPLEYSCFLKTCQLCNKKLCPDKDVYMYRGDQGFCSIECRSRQIALDEMRELETSTKKMVASYRHRCNIGPSETQILLEELQQRREHRSIRCQRNWAIVS
ncbi:FCS-Like Zinc finger 17-like [Corylus avellana]|uniref:FCS-Like Zinc finger 17-like n=1 Tax=Corylus avellana TaxID=13451 RepID=UPI00286A0CAC|nr:FCS-Like Zinc finger 17-like [Corylus avellana]